MKKLILFLFIISSFDAYSQQKLLGVEGGINVTNITKQRYDQTTNFQTGFNLGVSYENLLKRHFSFSVGLLYTQYGFDIPIQFTDDLGTPISGGPTFSYRYDYLKVPIKIGWRYGDAVYGFANIGIAPGAIMYAHHYFPSYEVLGMLFEETTVEVTTNARKYDVSGLAEIGGGYKLNNQFRIYGLLGFQHSFTPFSTPFYFRPSNLWHYGFNFSVGVKYNLNSLAKKAIDP